MITRSILLPLIATVMLFTVSCGGGSQQSDTPAPLTTGNDTSAVGTTAPTVTPDENGSGSADKSTPPPPTPTPTPLFLSVVTPLDESVLTTKEVIVSGKTLATAIASINGILTSVNNEGDFSSIVTLDEGPNILEVVVSDIRGEEVGMILTVIYLTEGE